jgi:hypothetical protein
VAGADDAAAAAADLGWPVAMKLTGVAIGHKSDLGAIALGLGTEGEVRDAFGRLSASPAADGAQVLLERMADPGVEVLVSATAAGVVPSLVIGLGGIWTEVLDEVAVVPLPADPDRVEAAVRSLRGAAMLTGGRGSERVDVGALAALAARAGEVLLEEGLGLIELNPVICGPGGAVAVDALARR